ncbi:MAG TPA: putative zinc-binding protein [Longimicrobiales bacterium]|nr:putative zinc-binding protein [Longimicrobiales bacterium]
MATEAGSFTLEVEGTTLTCPVGQRYAAEQIREGRIPVLSCEGPCIRGEIARQAAHRVALEEPFARACQGEAMAVPESEMARWVREADRVVVLDGCFLRCQARMMRRMLRPGQLVEIDALALYKKYTDKYAIDEVPEAERNAVAEEVAEIALAELADAVALTSNDGPGQSGHRRQR